MTDEDDTFLKELNEKLAQSKNASTQCSEDQFEEAMNLFEETSKMQQPFSSVGEPPPILSWDDMQNAFDDNLNEPIRTFAKDIYEHWKACREKNGNNTIHPGLRLKIMDGTNDTDDNDPYVCFRRREVRQIRKTRGRDAQSVEKLKKLRRELEEARQLVALVRQREITKKEQLAIEKQLFEQRSALRQCKLTLGEPYCQGDEDLLINQKVSAIPFSDPLLISLATQEEAPSGHHSARNRWSTKTGAKTRWPDCREGAHLSRRFARAERQRRLARNCSQEGATCQVERGLCRHDQLSTHAPANWRTRFQLCTCIHRVPSDASSINLTGLGTPERRREEYHRHAAELERRLSASSSLHPFDI